MIINLITKWNWKRFEQKKYFIFFGSWNIFFSDKQKYNYSVRIDFLKNFYAKRTKSNFFFGVPA